jgi:hypothetical protein
MKFLIIAGIVSILGQSSYASINNSPSEAIGTTLPEQRAARKPLPSTPNDRIARACLITAAELQEDYLKANGKYAANLNDLKWASEECLKNFSFNITADQKNYLIQIKNKKVAWQIDQDNIMTKLATIQ